VLKHPNIEPPTSGLYAPQGVTATIAQQMAEKAYDTGKVNTEQMIPAVFK
jgi:hypothetical protein